MVIVANRFRRCLSRVLKCNVSFYTHQVIVLVVLLMTLMLSLDMLFVLLIVLIVLSMTLMLSLDVLFPVPFGIYFEESTGLECLGLLGVGLSVVGAQPIGWQCLVFAVLAPEMGKGDREAFVGVGCC